MKQIASKQNHHRGYFPHELYIDPKYKSLKDEILHNIQYSLSTSQLNISIMKTNKLMDTNRARKIESRIFKTNDPYHYGIANLSPIRFTHLLAAVLYTDWSELCTEFSKTFRKLHKFESINMVKQRNREYANWSKNLRELIEHYGGAAWRDDWAKEFNLFRRNENGPYFCGMSFIMVMPQFNTRLNGPTSTTKQIAVATRFGGDDGIIITLNNNGYNGSRYLRFWNCSWISDYDAEDERIWCGGDRQIKIESVTIISSGKNFCNYFKTFYYFDCMLSGNSMRGETVDLKKSDIQMIQNLINYKLNFKGKISYPRYIVNTFDIFTDNKQQINLYLGMIDKKFKNLSDLLMRQLVINANKMDESLENINLFKSMMLNLFPNLNQIVIKTTGWEIGNYRYYAYVIDISSLLTLMNTSLSSHRNITVQVQAQHNQTVEFDKKTNNITKYEYVNVSWLSKYSQLASNKGIEFVTVDKSDGFGNKIATDILKITFPSAYNTKL